MLFIVLKMSLLDNILGNFRRMSATIVNGMRRVDKYASISCILYDINLHKKYLIDLNI